MTHLGRHEEVMLGVLGIIVLAIWWILSRRSKNAGSQIQLDDLLLGDDGKASKAAFVLGGSFLVTSWTVIFQTINGTLTDLTFSAYVAAWVAPTVTRLIKGGPTQGRTETTITQRTVATLPESETNGPKV